MQVSWQGSDAAGRPVLLVRLSRACDEFDGKAARQCAEAIISHVRALAPCHSPKLQAHKLGPPLVVLLLTLLCWEGHVLAGLHTHLKHATCRRQDSKLRQTRLGSPKCFGSRFYNAFSACAGGARDA